MPIRPRHTHVPLAIAALLATSGCADSAEELARLIWGADIMLADLSPVARVGATWESQGTAVAANIILPDDTVTSTFTEVTDHCTVFEGVSEWRSEEGIASFDLVSSMQQAQATYDAAAGRYVISGLVAAPAFAMTDQLVLMDAAGEELLRLDAPPPPADPGLLLGPPEGLRTVFHAPSGAYDHIVVFAADAGGISGQSGVMCGYEPGDTTLNLPSDDVPLVDSEAVAELQARGITPTSVSVAYHRATTTDAVFDDTITVHAGRMIQVGAGDLGL